MRRRLMVCALLLVGLSCKKPVVVEPVKPVEQPTLTIVDAQTEQPVFRQTTVWVVALDKTIMLSPDNAGVAIWPTSEPFAPDAQTLVQARGYAASLSRFDFVGDRHNTIKLRPRRSTSPSLDTRNWRPADPRPIAVLVSGIHSPEATWRSVGPALESYAVWRFETDLSASAADNARRLGNEVARLRSVHGPFHFSLVGHGPGATVARKLFSESSEGFTRVALIDESAGEFGWALHGLDILEHADSVLDAEMTTRDALLDILDPLVQSVDWPAEASSLDRPQAPDPTRILEIDSTSIDESNHLALLQSDETLGRITDFLGMTSEPVLPASPHVVVLFDVSRSASRAAGDDFRASLIGRLREILGDQAVLDVGLVAEEVKWIQSDGLAGKAAKQALRSTMPGESTYLAEAIEQATDRLLAEPSDVSRRLVLITDGLADVSQAIVSSLATAEITAHVLAVGPRINERLLRQISGRSGGTYSRVEGRREADEVLGSIACDLSARTLLLETTIASDRAFSAEFLADSSLVDLMVVGLGSPGPLELTAPSVVTADAHVTGGTWAARQYLSPTPGLWSVATNSTPKHSRVVICGRTSLVPNVQALRSEGDRSLSLTFSVPGTRHAIDGRGSWQPSGAVASPTTDGRYLRLSHATPPAELRAFHGTLETVLLGGGRMQRAIRYPVYTGPTPKNPRIGTTLWVEGGYAGIQLDPAVGVSVGLGLQILGKNGSEVIANGHVVSVRPSEWVVELTGVYGLEDAAAGNLAMLEYASWAEDGP